MPTADLSARRGCFADLATYPRAVKRFYDPRGRSTRTELAVLVLLPSVVTLLFGQLSGLINWPANALRWMIVIPIFWYAPIPASAARRFHDIGKSGWFALPILLICGVAVWAIWKDLEVGPHTSHDLWGNNDIAQFMFTSVILVYVVALLQPPKDSNNPHGPNPRPEPKVI